MAEGVAAETEGRIMTTPTPCKGCGKPVIFAKTPEGATIPLDARKHPIYRITGDGTCERVPDVFITHFATCPKANQFTKSG